MCCRKNVARPILYGFNEEASALVISFVIKWHPPVHDEEHHWNLANLKLKYKKCIQIPESVESLE